MKIAVFLPLLLLLARSGVQVVNVIGLPKWYHVKNSWYEVITDRVITYLHTIQ